MGELFSSPYFWVAVTSAGGWLWSKITGKRKDERWSRAMAALGEASALMMQFVFTAPTSQTTESLIVQCRGVVAMRLADVGIYEADREKLGPTFKKLVDEAIAKAVTKLVEMRSRVATRKPVPMAAAVARYLA